MIVHRTNRGRVTQDGELKKITLYAVDAKTALQMAAMHMEAGYTVAVGPMDQKYRGVRVTVWFKEGLWK